MASTKPSTISCGDDIEVFREWLIYAIDRVDFMACPDSDPLQAQEECGVLVNMAGDACARHGMPELYTESVTLAPHCNLPELGIHGHLCEYPAAKAFLAKCISSVGQHVKSSKTDGAQRQKPEAGRTEECRSAADIAYSQYVEAERARGEQIKDNEAYAWAKEQAGLSGEYIQSCESWKRLVRKAREKRGEQKKRRPRPSG